MPLDPLKYIVRLIVKYAGTIVSSNTKSINFTGAGQTTTSSVDDVIVDIPGVASSQEAIEDIVGAMVSGNTETGVAVTYDDSGGKLNFDAHTAGDARYAPIAKGVTNGDSHDHNGGDGAQIDHVNLANKGTNTHAQIDTHLASTSNPHSVTASQVGLGNADNTSDANKPVSTAQQTALNLKANLASPTFTGTVTIPDEAYGSGWNGELQPATKNAVYDQIQVITDINITTYQALGSVIKAEDFALNKMGTTSGLTSGRCYFAAIYLPTAQTITGIKWFQTTQGAYTGDTSSLVGLYTYSGGTLTQVAVSTDDTALWKVANNTVGFKAFSGTYAAVAGLYFIGILYHSSAQTTAPVLGALSNLASGNVAKADFTNSAMLYGFLSSQTTLPSPQLMSGLTTLTTPHWLALY